MTYGQPTARWKKWTFLGVLMVFLGAGGYWWYEKYPGADTLAGIPKEKQEWLSASLDLKAFTPEAVPDHIKVLSDKTSDAASKEKAAKGLWEIGPRAKKAALALLSTVKDPVPEVREMAAKAVGTVCEGMPEAVPTLVDALGDQTAGVRGAAAVSLSELWAADKRPKFESWQRKEREDEGERERRGARKDADEEERREERQGRPLKAPVSTVRALSPQAAAAAKPAIPALTKALRDSDVHVRASAASALGEAGALAQPAVGELGQILQKDADDDARLQACLALGNIGPGAEPAVPILIHALLEDKAFGVRLNTASSLGQIGRDGDKVVPALVEAYLKDPEPEVRTWCIMSMTRFNPAAPKLAQKTVESLAKDARYRDSPEFQGRLADFRKMLDRQLKAAATPPTKNSSPKEKKAEG
jgi:HEAT repeat protein